jgi:hypothetical protein
MRIVPALDKVENCKSGFTPIVKNRWLTSSSHSSVALKLSHIALS